MYNPSFIFLNKINAIFGVETGELHIAIVLTLVLLFISFQFVSFLRNKERIKQLKNIFRHLPETKIVKLIVSEEILNKTSAQEIFEHTEDHKELSEEAIEENQNENKGYEVSRKIMRLNQTLWVHPENFEHYTNLGWIDFQDQKARKKTSWVEIPFFEYGFDVNPIFKKILDGLNMYLIRNKGSITDFNLMKDIVDRNCDSVDEEINTGLPAPIYLGLMGTMFGIIISIGLMTLTGDMASLFNPDVNKESNFNVLSILLGGVGLAMISSFTGLAFTMANSLHNYKGAKVMLEKHKNDFFTFIQTELLPLVSQNTASSLQRLEANLSKFNETFSKNNENLKLTFEMIHESFVDHAKAIKEIKSINLEGIAEANARVLKELKENTQMFEDFNNYMGKINNLLFNADNLSKKLNAQLERTISIERIAEHIQQNTTDNKDIIDYMRSHMQSIKERTILFNRAISDLDSVLDKSITELKTSIDTAVRGLHKHTEDSIEKVRAIQIGQFEDVGKHKNLFDKLNHLTNIEEGFMILSKTLKEQQMLMRDININFVNAIGIRNPELKLKSFKNKLIDNSRLIFYTSGSVIAVAYIIRQIILFIL